MLEWFENAYYEDAQKRNIFLWSVSPQKKVSFLEFKEVSGGNDCVQAFFYFIVENVVK